MAMEKPTANTTRIMDLDRDISRTRTQIESLNNYIAANRHDRESMIDAEQDLAEYETRLDRLIKSREQLAAETVAKKNVAPIAKHTLRLTAIGLKTMTPIVRKKTELETIEIELKELNASYRILADKLDVLDEKMFSCRINMDFDTRSWDIATQSADDLNTYKDEYDSVSANMNRIAARINALKQRRESLCR